MRKIEKYVCEFCKEEFNSVLECENHEVSHAALDHIKTMEYGINDKYPTTIKLAFADGCIKDYYIPEE